MKRLVNYFRWKFVLELVKNGQIGAKTSNVLHEYIFDKE